MTANNTLSERTDGSPVGPKIATIMPWRFAMTICAAALVLGVAGYVVKGSMAGTAGFAVGLFAGIDS